jgi:predicted membrane-bound spermidine synthase
MASDTRLPEPESIRLQLPMRFLDRETLRESFHLPSDVREVGIQPSGLDHPKILDYYLQGWQHWK